MITNIKTIACSENGSYNSKKHTVKVSNTKGIVRHTFDDLDTARLFMLDEACRLINDGECKEEELTIIPYTN